MKSLFFSASIFLSLCNLSADLIDSQAATVHITFNFSEEDKSKILSISEELEAFYVETSEEFSFLSEAPMQINLYPSLQSFHESIGLVDGPEWVVARTTHNAIDVVSPANPGPYHTEESINKIIKLNIVKSILYGKFGIDNIPYWLAYGIGALKAEYNAASYPIENIPSLSELETNSCKEFQRIGGYQLAPLFVAYIQNTYGFSTLIDLLSNYDLYKETLYQSWITSLSSCAKEV